MKNLFFAGLLTILLMPHFSNAADPVDSEAKPPHHHVHTVVKSQLPPVDINQANEKDLSTLKGIGLKKAALIVAYRAAHGPFKSFNELAHVRGIGEKSAARLQANNPGRIVVGQK